MAWDALAVALADVNRDGLVDLVVSQADPVLHATLFRQDRAHPGAFLDAIELPGEGQLVTLAPFGPDVLPEWIYDDGGGVLRLPLSAPRHPWP
jgi:hypothetical protein